MIVLPSLVFFFQSFHRVNMMCSGSRHFESERAWSRSENDQRLPSWIRNECDQRLKTFNENKMAASSLSFHFARSLSLFPSRKLRCFCTQGDSHTVHVPVMLKECLSFLAPRDGQVSRVKCSLWSGYKPLRATVFISSCVRLPCFRLFYLLLEIFKFNYPTTSRY